MMPSTATKLRKFLSMGHSDDGASGAETQELSQREICRVALQRLPVWEAFCEPPLTRLEELPAVWTSLRSTRDRRTRKTTCSVLIGTMADAFLP